MLVEAGHQRQTWSVNLPLTSFVGRQREVARLEQLLHSTRLLTLVGTGGVGKTRLALKLMTDAATAYADGVWLIELAGLAEPGLVAQAVAAELGVVDQQDRPIVDRLTELLRDSEVLLVLDNCEHLVGACADLAHILLRNNPNLHIMATSREPLNVDGETTWLVPPLALGLSDAPVEEQLEADAVQLFLQRARSVVPDFHVTDANRDAVLAICRVLDGIPLAVELAAARLRALAPADVLARLSMDLSLLVGGSRTLPQRQRTLRAALDWSHGLLTEPERQVFERLSTFAGGWQLDAAESICSGNGIDRSDILDRVTSLVDKSLVVMEPKAPATRYRLLGPLKQFAAERLDLRGPAEVDRVREQHARFYVALAARSFPPNWEASAEQLRQFAGHQRERLERLEQDHDNFRSALGWLIANEKVEDAQRLALGFWQFWLLRGYFGEGRVWMQRVLQLPGGHTAMRIRILLGAGFLAFRHDAISSARDSDEEALSLAQQIGDPACIALALYRLGDLARARSRHAEARALLDAAVDVSIQAKNPGLEAWSRTGRGSLALAENDLEFARRVLSDAVAIFRTLENQYGFAVSARRLGATLYRLGEHAAGRRLIEEASQVCVSSATSGKRPSPSGSWGLLRSMSTILCAPGAF